MSMYGGQSSTGSDTSSIDYSSIVIRDRDRQVYGQIIEKVEDNRYETMCSDNTNRICFVHGRVVQLVPGDIILVDLREDGPRGILKYSPEMAWRLKKIGELPKTMKLDGELPTDDDDGAGEVENVDRI